MILNVSGRTDIVAFYTEWFMNRYKDGFLDVRNPFNPKLVSRINFDNVDLIMFCTKNPIPIIPHLKEINKPILFHITITPYLKDIEPNVIDKRRIIDGVKEISKLIGIENIYVRYDPIFISDKYTVDYHIKMFNKMCNLLGGYVKHIIISFMDEYKNVKDNRHILRYKYLTEGDYKDIGINFSRIAKSHNMTIQTCFEKRSLEEYGFNVGECISKKMAYNLTGKKYKSWKARNCNCAEMVDIGVYNTCKHMCKYCYANYDENNVYKNVKRHNPNSSLLIGELESDDIIKERLK